MKASIVDIGILGTQLAQFDQLSNQPFEYNATAHTLLNTIYNQNPTFNDTQ
jgi:hypothetical protein